MSTKVNIKGTYDDLYPAIMGTAFTDDKKISKPVVCDQSILKDFSTFVATDNVYSKLLYETNSADYFFKACPDFKKLVNGSKTALSEAFYAYKLDGKYLKEVSTKLQYQIKLSYAAGHEIPNMIFKFMPYSVMKEIFTEGFLPEGITVRDVICELCDPGYKPVCSYNPINRLQNFTEVYVKATDMVVAVTHKAAERITPSNVADIEVGPHGLNINGVYLRTMGDYVGHVMSVYDLRDVI